MTLCSTGILPVFESGRHGQDARATRYNAGMIRKIGLAVLLLCSGAMGGELVAPALPGGLGVNIHFTQPRAGEMKMMREAGFRFVRMDFDWGRTEKEKGKYNFVAYEGLMKELDANGMRAVFILDYVNPLYDDGKSPYTDDGRNAFAKWAAEGVKHFKGRGILWEMYNEPNISQFWHPTANVDDYVKLAVEVGKAIRAAAPDEFYIGPAMSTIDVPFLEKCLQGGLLEYWSAVSVHPYRQDAPESVEEDYRKIRLMIRQYAPKGKQVPILSGEWGYSSAWGGFDPDKQGNMLPRQWLTNVMNEVPLSIWYDWHDDGPDAKEAEHHFGTVLNEYHEGRDPVYDAKPAYLAAKTLTGMLDGFKYNKQLGGQPLDHLLMFDKGDEVRFAAWTLLDRPHDVMIPATAGTKFTTYDHLGAKIGNPEAGEKGLSLQLKDAPMYIVPEKADDVMRALAAWERAPLEVVGKHSEITRVALKFTNPLEKRIYTKSSVVGAASKQWVRPGGSVPLGVRVSLLRDPNVMSWPFDLQIGEDGGASQMMRFIVTNPLIAKVLPPAGNRMAVRVENPSGEPFTGSVRASVMVDLRQEPQKVSQPLQLVEGQKEAVVGFAVQERMPVMVEVVDSGNHAFAVNGFEVFSPVSLAAGDYEIKAEGDKAVKSVQSIENAAAADAPPGGVENVLKLKYAFDAGWKFACVKSKDQTIMLPGKPTKLLMWVRGDGSENVTRMRFVDSGGQTFQADGPKLTDNAWHLAEFALDGSKASHWAGANDGVVHHPIRIESLLLVDSASRGKTEGEVFIAGPTLIYVAWQ
jgi:hypothetical protein